MSQPSTPQGVTTTINNVGRDQYNYYTQSSGGCASSRERAAQQLNEFVQAKYHAASHLGWETQQIGTLYSPHWVAVARINGVEYGRGSAGTLHVAKEMAAQEALSKLKR